MEILPDRYPSPVTCRRRHRLWTQNGSLAEAWKRLLSTLRDCREDNQLAVELSKAGDTT